MRILFKDSGRWEATCGPQSSDFSGAVSSRDAAISGYARKLSADRRTEPFYIHTYVDVVFESDSKMLLDWVVSQARAAGINHVENFEELMRNEKVMSALTVDLNVAVNKALGAVQQNNKLTLVESYPVYPREYLQYCR